MSYPNSALSAWQLALIAVVAASALAGWLVAVFLAARSPRPDRAASASAERTGAAGSVRGTGDGADRGTGPGPGAGQPDQAGGTGDRLAAA